jgi:RNA polymerase sigma factor (sigma-70 family)
MDRIGRRAAMSRSGARVEVNGAIDGLVRAGSLIGLAEDELLARLTNDRDTRVFEIIVGAYGPMVYGVSRQLLSDPNDVEDAVQAAFLVLIRKAGTIRRLASLAAWLYGVAYRFAIRLKRAHRPGLLRADHAVSHASCPAEERERVGALHQEINRLPEKYRPPIVLCYFEGLTHDAAARRLHWPVGT